LDLQHNIGQIPEQHIGGAYYSIQKGKDNPVMNVFVADCTAAAAAKSPRIQRLPA
jgi:hypothetical protein